MIADIHQATGHGIRQICATLHVPRSSYYHASTPTAMQSSDQEIGGKIETIFKQHRRRYGYRRIREELCDQGIACAVQPLVILLCHLPPVLSSRWSTSALY